MAVYVRRDNFGAAVLCMAALLGGCAARHPPAALSIAAVRVMDADDADASQYAPLEMRLAREKVDGARKAFHEDDYDESKRLAEEASADAHLAQVKARTERTRRQADQVRSRAGTSQRGATSCPE